MKRPPSPSPHSSPEEADSWRDTYEQTAYQELPWYDPGPNVQVRLAVEEKFLPSRGQVLDIGCGAGSNALYLAGKGYSAHGLDLSPGALRAARDRAREGGALVHLLQGDAALLPIRTGTLDAVFDNGCFHSLPFELRAPYAGEVARVVRPEGRMVLAWIGRETVGDHGPPHRPSLREVVEVFEEHFIFARTGSYRHPRDAGWMTYFAWMERRSTPQPPVR